MRICAITLVVWMPCCVCNPCGVLRSIHRYLRPDLRVGDVALGCGRAGSQHVEVDLHADARRRLGCGRPHVAVLNTRRHGRQPLARQCLVRCADQRLLRVADVASSVVPMVVARLGTSTTWQQIGRPCASQQPGGQIDRLNDARTYAAALTLAANASEALKLGVCRSRREGRAVRTMVAFSCVWMV